jgi:hypothetical protein
VGNRFMVAYLKGVRQYSQGKTDRNVELVAEFTKMTPEEVRTICWPAVRNNGQVNVDPLVDFENWAKEAGYLDAIVPADKFWDGSFVEYANGVLGSGQ